LLGCGGGDILKSEVVANGRRLETELRDHLSRLEPTQQRQVVEFARTLAVERLRGVPGGSLIRFGGTIGPTSDLALIEEAVEAGCERVTLDEW